jgi:hypothetical protein
VLQQTAGASKARQKRAFWMGGALRARVSLLGAPANKPTAKKKKSKDPGLPKYARWEKRGGNETSTGERGSHC